MFEFKYLDEPFLTFGHDQASDDPRAGLFLYGPLRDARKPHQMRIGLVATPNGVGLYRSWVKKINGFMRAPRAGAMHQFSFPGFEPAFATSWPEEPVVTIPVSEADISRTLRLSDRHVATYEAVSLFVNPIRRKLVTDDVEVDVWFIVIPEIVYTFGRPLSRIPYRDRILVERRINSRIAKRLRTQPSLFAEEMEEARVYAFDLDFHDQLKARLLPIKAVAQIVRETSIEERTEEVRGARRTQDPATVAWNLTTTSFFKAGGRPWKLSRVRDKVCYVGIVYKVDPRDEQSRSACCGAQMFLDSGDGLVFKGAIGEWYSKESREFHLDAQSAYQLLRSVIDEYTHILGSSPEELFIHSRTRFNDEEWSGFRQAAGAIDLVGVKITRSSDVKAYRPGTTPVMRGTALEIDRRRGYLWTAGYVPKLQTYAGREVPNPLQIEILRGDAALSTVMLDVLGLTKLNFNACIYADGLPVTLRFADTVGDILTAAPPQELPPLPFRHYI